MSPASPFLIGIDLGTTNSALAWLDTAAGSARLQLFDVPQLVAAGEIGAQPTLPSFLYLPAPGERSSGAWSLPWSAEPDAVAGVHARDHGALVPTRLVSSAKSWLSNPAVDRRAALLPWAQEDAAVRLSPVDASSRILVYLRDAWRHAHAQGETGRQLERQTIVLTVPASFDEEARELTVEAARTAGFDTLTLLEEPLAALYAWMATHRDAIATHITEGQLVLVCDVGGGTTDFSLFRAHAADDGIRFERTAIGEHLLLGGDNLDLALAAVLERRLVESQPGPKLTLTQRQALRRQCSAAKERLMSDGPAGVSIAILGSGRGLVAGTLTGDLTRADVEAALDDFLPVCDRDARPSRDRRHGLRELGLPYESDPAITRHLAAFLARAARLEPGAGDPSPMVRPDAVLFNGGFFAPPAARERVLDALTAWFGTRPAVLVNDRPEAAVALGAAFFNWLRHHPAAGRRLLVRAGSGRAYYIGVQTQPDSPPSAVCVMPRGTEEGTRLVLDRDVTAISNQPAAFTLYSSLDRDDPAGALVPIGDDLHRHAPLVTALSFGKRSRRVPVAVRLSVRFTEVGTLELWCESRTTDHRWRLQFNLRAVEHDAAGLPEVAPAAPATGTGEGRSSGPSTLGAQTAGTPGGAAPSLTPAVPSGGHVVLEDESIAAAEGLIRAAFAGAPAEITPDALVGALEGALGHGKPAWPLPVIRRLADVLIDCVDGRRLSARHEARWLNLTGFCLRPGFGTATDPWRITELRKVYAADLVYPRETQNQVEWLVLWQRVAGGFTAQQQQELARKLTGMLGLGARKGPHLNPQVIREAWRLLGSLERLDSGQRTKFGDELLVRIRRDPRNASLVWALARLGARIPFHGPLNTVVPPAAAERWMAGLLQLKSPGPDVWVAVGQMGARTGDPARDIGEATRQSALARLADAGAPPDAMRPLRDIVPVDGRDVTRIFGETLPEGLQIP